MWTNDFSEPRLSHLWNGNNSYVSSGLTGRTTWDDKCKAARRPACRTCLGSGGPPHAATTVHPCVASSRIRSSGGPWWGLPGPVLSSLQTELWSLQWEVPELMQGWRCSDVNSSEPSSESGFLCLISSSLTAFGLYEFPLSVLSEGPERMGLRHKAVSSSCPSVIQQRPDQYFIGSEGRELTLQLERLRGGCAVPQSQDVKPCPLTSLQALPAALLNLQQSCSLGWASGPLLGILLLPFVYFAPLYSLGLSLNIMALSSLLDQVESLCVLLSQHHLGQRLLVFSWCTWLPSCFIKSQFNREATCTVKRLLLIAFVTVRKLLCRASKKLRNSWLFFPLHFAICVFPLLFLEQRCND